MKRREFLKRVVAIPAAVASMGTVAALLHPRMERAANIAVAGHNLEDVGLLEISGVTGMAKDINGTWAMENWKDFERFVAMVKRNPERGISVTIGGQKIVPV